jgi:hypothetical protein
MTAQGNYYYYLSKEENVQIFVANQQMHKHFIHSFRTLQLMLLNLTLRAIKYF